MMSESPDTIHGRMKEGAHIAGYSLSRSIENLRWLLEEGRFEQLSPGYRNVNEFLRDISDAFKLLDIKPEERKQIAELVKRLQPQASQRAIADMVGVDKDTVARDLGYERPGGNTPKEPEILDVFGGNTPPSPALPPDDFNHIEIERYRQQRELRSIQLEKERKEMMAQAESVPLSDRWRISQGNIEDWQATTKYDFIITDPPYPRKYLPLYETLAHRANTWLKPGGLLVAMCGQSYLIQIIKMMSKHLDYYWTSAYLTPGQPKPLHQRQVNSSWKPLLFFIRNGDEYRGKIFGDVFTSDGNDKSLHEWGQSESGMYAIIRQVCLPGQSILDPFCGAGTTGVAALKHGCFFEGIDIDDTSVKLSITRLSMVVK